MASVLIAKPGTVSGWRLSRVGDTGPIGATADNSSFFYIKMRAIEMDFSTKLVKTTGDGDTDTYYDNDEKIYASFVIDGWMTNSQAIGLSALQRHTEAAGSKGEGQGVAGSSGLRSMKVNLSQSRAIYYNNVRVEEVIVNLNTQEPFIPVRIIGMGHDTTRTYYETGA